MDKSKTKRKLRSGKEVGKTEVADKAKRSDSEVTSPIAKRIRADDSTGAGKGKGGTSTEKETGPKKVCSPEEDAATKPLAGGGADHVNDDGRTCSVCNFVAKTPTALKVHAKRKHFGEGVNIRKETTTSMQQEAGRKAERVEIADTSEGMDDPPQSLETQCSDLTGEALKDLAKEKQAVASDSSHSQCRGPSASQADSLKDGQLQSPEGQVENIPLPKCQKTGEADFTKSATDVSGKPEKGQASLTDDKRTIEEDSGDCQAPAFSTEDTDTKRKNPRLKTKAKRGHQAIDQNKIEGDNLSPTQILLEMVETEAESKSVEESSNLDTSDQSGGDKRLSKGSMHAENSSEAAVAQDESGGDCQTFGKVDSIAGSAPVEPKEAESVEEQGKDQKPIDQHTCSHCGRMFCDKPTLAMHVKKCHSKGTNFFCEPCSYACVDKSNFEKHCSSNKHKMKVKESTDALSHTLTAGDGNKLEGTLKTTAQVLSESSAGVTTAELQLKAQNSTACRNAKATSKGEDQVVKEVISGELIQDYVQEALPSEGQKSSGENTLTEDDTEKIKEAPPGIQQCDAAGSTDELAEKSPLKKRRGRPKGSTTTTCQYCGLVASNATNLSVHIRRRHSREYGFICKVCSYSCVTKGDMDRHCATKKHMKRVKGTKDDQSQDSSVKVVEVVVSGSQQREGEAPKGEDQEEAGSTLSTGKRTTSHLQDESQALADDAQTGSADPEDDTAELTGPAPKKSKYDSVNTCTYCGFVAHSLPSLELHVKRKHTRDFEFVCLACNYYAVTCREMSRHATTDKHRQKSQSYLEFLGTSEGGVTQLDVSAEAVPESGPGDQNVTFSGSTSVQESASDKDRQADAESHPGIPSPNGEIAASCDGKEALNQPEQDGAEVGVEIRAEHQAVMGQDDIEEVAVGQGRIQPMNDPENAEPKDQEYASHTGDTQATSMVDSPVTEVSGGHAASPAQESAGVEAESEVEDDGVLEGSSDAEGELADGSVDSPSASKVLLRALPFDASIVPFRALFEGDVSTLPGKKAAPRQRVTTTAAAANALKKTKVPTRSSGATKGGGAARIRCEDCGFMADGLSGLNVHVSMKHPSKDKHFHCLLCGKSFYTESNLHQHLTSAAHLRNEQASIKELPEGGASFKCVKCSDPFVTEQDLFHHIKDKHEELLREVNKYVLEDTEQINREREENQGCVCKYCGKVCKSSNSMAFLAHVRTHTGSKPFKCKLCDFATAQLGDARNHVKRHLGVREYKCPVCG
ncbi:hypothetical protein JZ751_015636 [Albula glossodonta]|uniref:C2H2-type domain-containing protein n=1 Tax=Albula glossodonta TaxID=121402 RepID=A0A8T2NUH9_9TELE|nr:hypothetical protein JZ751_015636 [Albula glossodonta]